MPLADVLVIAAIVLAPGMALVVDRIIAYRKDERQRRMDVFRRLMATRGRQLTVEHVTALNMIEVEFYKKSENVIDAWREYHSHLSVPEGTVNTDPAEFAIWMSKASTLLVELLFAMSKRLGYRFDKVQLKSSGSYTPQAFGNVEQANNLMRQGLLQVLSGEDGLPVRQLYSEEEIKDNARIRKALLELLDSSRLVQKTKKSATKRKS